jgi:hypothetical protein
VTVAQAEASDSGVVGSAAERISPSTSASQAPTIAARPRSAAAFSRAT